jgi:hypothetical protein
MNNSGLSLNCFPVTLLPMNYTLPYLHYESWKSSTNKLKNDFKDYSWYRLKLNDGRVRALIFNGPEQPRDLRKIDVDVATLPDFGKHIIRHSMVGHFKARGFVISRKDKGYDTTVLRTSPDFSEDLIDIYCGVSFQIRRPFVEFPDNFVMSVQWEVKTTFNQSISEPRLKAMAMGMPVIYRPSPNVVASEDMRPFQNRYLGRVCEISSQSEAVIDSKDHVLRRVALADLFLEASPAVIREYERQSGLRRSSRSLWYKLQELSLVLNGQGRRNTSVLKDRLQSVRAFLGGNSKEQLIIPLSCFQEGSISLGLSPLSVEVR